MEFDKKKTFPNSTLEFLLTQVDEQADVCDVTVKMGNWERKYHRCVIIASPFFECVLRNDFIERKTGTIILHQGSPASIDMAIMFLYGQRPHFSHNSIVDTIDMAEFLLIPNLKAACYNWLTRRRVTKETCLSWILLSSKYGFDLEHCDEYLESHLPEVMNQPSAVNLTYKSVDYILSSKKLIYFSMEDKLRFVIRWYIAQPLKRKDFTEKLIEWLRFDDISESCLNDVKCNPLVESLLRDVRAGNEVGNELIEVLISKKIIDQKLFCYDLTRDIWYKIRPKITISEIFSIAYPDASEVYFNSNENNVWLKSFNFVTEQLKEYHVVTDRGEPMKCSSSDCTFKSTLFVLCKVIHVTTKIEDEWQNLLKINKTVTTIYVGHIKGDEIQMHPQFSLPNCNVKTSASNGESVVALMPAAPGRFIVLYDVINCTIDKIPLKTDVDDRIFPYKSGFVIHNDKRCVTIKRMLGPSLSKRYIFKEIAFDNNESTYNTYFFCKDTWYRFRQESYGSCFQFKCIEHSSLQQAPLPSDAVWKELSPPLERTWDPLAGPKFILRLPKRFLRCSLDCPHCNAHPTYYEVEDASYSEDDSGRYYDEDESSDDSDKYYDEDESSDD